MLLTIVDIGDELVQEAISIGWQNEPNVELLANKSVQDIPLTSKTAFVSPANSFGYMNSGIDEVYSEDMFPMVEKRVKASFKIHGQKSLHGRKFLPIGKAVIVCADDESKCQLIAAPTMWLPQNVSQTQNAYSAMYAALTCAHDNGIVRLVVPGLCTGYGMMSYKVAVEQMYAAFLDVRNGKCARYSLQEIVDQQDKKYNRNVVFYKTKSIVENENIPNVVVVKV